MSSPTAPPPAGARRRSWPMPTAAAAALLVLASWLLAPALGELLAVDEPGPSPAANAPAAVEPSPTSPAAPTAQPTTTPATTAPAPSLAPSPSTSTEASASGDVAGDTGELPPEEAWRPVAEGFARDFTTPGQDWAARLGAWATPELAASYAWTDPNRQPTGALHDLEVTTQDPTSVQARATYTGTGADELVVDLQLLLTPDGWRVATASPGNSS